ncbi:MAG: hypothetical protein Q7R97_01850 [Candidatus Daviesbacteria bacterium]|nr:hypothetical protein [Candidatus Daviesbacteria bacterium]
MINETKGSKTRDNIQLAEEIDKERIADQLRYHGKTDAELQREADNLLKKAGYGDLTKWK